MALTLSLTPIASARGERDLVIAARRGDDRAFEELYARYRDLIFSFILSKVRDHGRAEDIAQEVFISALRRLRSSDQEIAFKPWIYEIAKNACIDEFRRGSRSREVPLQTDGEPVTDQHSMPSVLPTPPAAVETKQRLDDLRGAFGGLSETHHRLLVMRELEGLSYDEIGNRLGMTRQMVESGLFRARRKLTDEYDDLASGRRCGQVQHAIENGDARSVSSLGLRERRRFARHLAHCQPCRLAARMAGVDEALIKPRSIAAKIAALLPFPLWRWPWRGHGCGAGTGISPGSSHAGVGPVQNAASLAGSANSSITLGQAAAAAAALAIAGAGGGLVHVLTQHPAGHRPPALTRPHAAGGRSSAAGATRAPAPAATASRQRHPAGLRTGQRTARLVGPRASSASRRHRRPARGRRSSTGGAGGAAPTTARSASTSISAPSLGTVTGASGAPLRTAAGAASTVANGIRSTVAATTNAVSQTAHSVVSSPPVTSVASGVSQITPPVSTSPTPPPTTAATTVSQVAQSLTSAVTKASSSLVP
jgi:RNA polymerase sigma factor (sigma-70 family)